MAQECFLCGDENDLIEVVTGANISIVCLKCAEKNSFPRINHPTNEQISRANRFLGVNERLMNEMRRIHKPDKVNNELKKIVAENIKPGEYKDLVDNFHWNIQQARRFRKISQKQLGESIAEPEIVIAMAEKANLPVNYERLIKKLEQFLGVQLFKQQPKQENFFKIENANLNQVTTSDLKAMKENVDDKKEPVKSEDFEQEE